MPCSCSSWPCDSVSRSEVHIYSLSFQKQCTKPHSLLLYVWIRMVHLTAHIFYLVQCPSPLLLTTSQTKRTNINAVDLAAALIQTVFFHRPRQASKLACHSPGWGIPLGGAAISQPWVTLPFRSGDIQAGPGLLTSWRGRMTQPIPWASGGVRHRARAFLLHLWGKEFSILHSYFNIRISIFCLYVLSRLNAPGKSFRNVLQSHTQFTNN